MKEKMYPHPISISSSDFSFEKVDVVIIGGGIIGVSAALALAEAKISVALVEKGEIGAEQSCRNWGFCRTAGRDVREIPLAQSSLKIWDSLKEKTQKDLGFHRKGIIHACINEKELEEREEWLKEAKTYEVDSKIIDQRELGKLIGSENAKSFVGALYTSTDGRAEPQLAAPAIALAAQNLGAKIYTYTAARGISFSAGKVSEVVTERGVIKCDNILISGGAWSKILCQNIGVDFPQLTVRSTASRIAIENGKDSLSETSFFCSDFSYRKHIDSTYTLAKGVSSVADIIPDSFKYLFKYLPMLKQEHKFLKLKFGKRFLEMLALPSNTPLDKESIFERNRILNPDPYWKYCNQALDEIKSYMPLLGTIRVLKTWAGYIDVTPDAVPVISSIPNHDDIYIASGFSGHGFGIGPGAGYLVADLISGKVSQNDFKQFDFSRMNDKNFQVKAGI